MWSSAGANIGTKQANNMSNNKVSSNSHSKSSSSTRSSPPPFSPSSPIPNQSMTGNSIWDDINLASLHDHPNTNFLKNTCHHASHGMMFQDFLARTSNKDTPTSVACMEPSSGWGNNFFKKSLGSPRAAMLSLNSGSDHFQYQESSTSTVPVRPNPHMHSHASGGTLSFDSSLESPFDALGSSSLFPSICQKRPQLNVDVSCGDRRHERMVKNRESAARSRARKQAYTTELEREVALLAEENAKLRRQQERFLAAAPAKLSKKHTLYRTSTAPF